MNYSLQCTYFYYLSILSSCHSGSGPGFWDEVASPAVSPVKPAAQATKKATPVKSASTSNVATAAQATKSNSSAKKKKEEATVLKLFEQTVQRTDEFSQWCHKALASLQSSVDGKGMCFIFIHSTATKSFSFLLLFLFKLERKKNFLVSFMLHVCISL